MKKFLAVLSMFFLLGSQSSIALGQTRIFRGSQGQLTDVEGVQAEGSGSLPKPILIGGDNGTDITNILVDLQGHLQVDVLSNALPTGAATEAKQDDQITLLTTIDADTSILAAFDFATEVTLADIADVLSSDILDALTGHEGDFQAVFTTQISRNVDAVGGATDGGIPSLVLRDDVLTTLTPVDGDYVRLRVNSVGALHITASGGAIALASEFAEDSVAGDGDTGQFVMGVANPSIVPRAGIADYLAIALSSTGATLSVPVFDTTITANLRATHQEDGLAGSEDAGISVFGVANTSLGAKAGNGDYLPASLSTSGASLAVTVYDASISSSNSAVKRENDAFGGGEALVGIAVIRDDVLTTLVPPDGDFTVVRVDSLGRLHTTGGTANPQVFGAGTEALAQRVTIATDSTGVLSVDDNGGSLTVDGTFFQATQPISAVALPLPTGASTEATLSGLNSKIPSLGAALIASSQPVNIASDQVVPISATSLPLPSGASTSALQTTGNAILTTIDADTSALFGTVSGSEQQVDIVAALPAGTNNIGDVDVLTVPVSGTAFFSIKDTAIAAASQNFAFGFTSKKIIIEAPSTNGADVCIDLLGATAVCPAADTAGDYRLAPGTSIIFDDYAVTSLSAISASGTVTINVSAVN